MNSLQDLPLLLPPVPHDNSVHSWHLFVIRLTADSPLSRDDVIAKLCELGIGTSVHYVPLHRHPYWQSKYQLSPSSFPVTEEAYSSMISIPLYTKMSDPISRELLPLFLKFLVDFMKHI